MKPVPPAGLGLKAARVKSARFFYGYVIVAAGTMVMFSTFGMTQSFGVFLKPILADFGWTRGETAAAYSLYSFVLAGSFFITGKLTERLGPRVVTSACGLLLGLGHVLMSQVGAVWQLYLLYGGLIGMGASGSFIPMAATVARWFHKRRTLMTGILVSGVGAGAMVFPPLVGWLIAHYGWRRSFLISGIIVTVLIILAGQFLKKSPADIGERAYGDTDSDPRKVISETRRGFSLEEAVRTRLFWVLSFSYLTSGLGSWVISVHIVAHATDIGFAPLAAARVMTIYGAANIAGRILAGYLADRTSNKLALILGLSLMAVPFAWLAFGSELWMLYLFAAVFGFGFGGPSTVMSPIVAEYFGLKQHGVILSIVNWVGLMGGAAGAFLAGYLFDIFGSYFTAFTGTAVLVVLGLLVSIVIKSPERRITPSG